MIVSTLPPGVRVIISHPDPAADEKLRFTILANIEATEVALTSKVLHTPEERAIGESWLRMFREQLEALDFFSRT